MQKRPWKTRQARVRCYSNQVVHGVDFAFWRERCEPKVVTLLVAKSLLLYKDSTIYFMAA